jgi:nickel-type superoxide dismutase maturation protease
MTTLVGVVIALSAIFGMLRRRYVVATVDGLSMMPTLMPGDRLLVRRVAIRQVRRGQIVVVLDPAWPSAWVVKRVAAVHGDPPSGLYVLGDNTQDSRDSRHYGYLTAGALLGVVRRSYPQRKENHARSH